MSQSVCIPPGSCIGILGAGQLGKMTALAAARLGYRTAIWSPPGDTPAMDVAAYPIKAPYEDPDAFNTFTRLANVATFEFENIPVALVEEIAKVIPMRPGAEVLRVTQDRFEEKKFFWRIGVPATRTLGVDYCKGARPAVFRSLFLDGD